MMLEVCGMARKASFERAKAISRDLYETCVGQFEKPEFYEFFEFNWNEFLSRKKKELSSFPWDYDDSVIVFRDGVAIGSDDDLYQWAKSKFDYKDYRPTSLYASLANSNYQNKLYNSNRLYISVLISIGEERCGSLLFELYSDVLPKTCENFRSLCTGEKGDIKKNEVEKYRLHYKGTHFFRIVANGWIQGGDVLYSRGNDGCSIYGQTFEDESFAIKHDCRGVLSMANAGRHSNGSQFFITLAPSPWMDNMYVAFGHIIEGSSTLQKMEQVPTQNERPVQNISIADIKVMDPLYLSTKLV